MLTPNAAASAEPFGPLCGQILFAALATLASVKHDSFPPSYVSSRRFGLVLVACRHQVTPREDPVAPLTF
jgi:hypothetical protein